MTFLSTSLNSDKMRRNSTLNIVKLWVRQNYQRIPPPLTPPSPLQSLTTPPLNTADWKKPGRTFSVHLFRKICNIDWTERMRSLIVMLLKRAKRNSLRSWRDYHVRARDLFARGTYLAAHPRGKTWLASKLFTAPPPKYNSTRPLILPAVQAKQKDSNFHFLDIIATWTPLKTSLKSLYFEAH